ncbi:hypothetical protein MKY37_21185 [Psychrobacillus sp. FSL K6-2836]
MLKKYITLIISCIILLLISGCNWVDEEKVVSLTKTVKLEER